MATVFQITDGTTTVDLWNGTLKLRDRTWTPRTPASENAYAHSMYGARYTFKNYGIVVESFDLVADTGNNAALIQEINKLEKLFEEARQWHMDSMQLAPVVLRAYSDTEAAKQSLIYEASLQYPADIPGFHQFAPGRVIVRVNISRHPLWESTTSQSNAWFTKTSLGGYVLDAGTPIGTAPGKVTLNIAEVSGGNHLGNVWFGIRRKYSASASFNPVIELESGSNGTDTASAADAGASGGNKKTVTFVTTTLSRRVYWSIVLPAAESYRGRYLVLCRMKLSAGSTTAGVQLKYDFGGGANPVPCEEVYFTDTNWRLVELGEIQLPPSRVLSWDLSGYYFELWAERLNGAGNLDLDCIILIPSDQFLSAKNGTVGTVALTMDYNDVPVITNLVSGTVYSLMQTSVRNLYTPANENWLWVVAAERPTQHVLTDNVDVSLYWTPRWLSYRGA